MSLSILSNLTSNYVQSILGTALQGAGLASSTSSTSVASSQSQTDNSQLSPFAQLLSTLQQLQTSNPAEYKQVTQQIATNLQSAASTATTDGNTTAAAQLNQLATDFNSASQSGQLPNVQDLAQATNGGGHHHHHHAHGGGSSSATDQLLQAFQANSTQNDALNPFSIIENTLTSAGVTTGSNT